jgi:hypothetical protein
LRVNGVGTAENSVVSAYGQPTSNTVILRLTTASSTLSLVNTTGSTQNYRLIMNTATAPVAFISVIKLRGL